MWRFYRTTEIPIIGTVAFDRREPDAASRDHKSRLTASRAQPQGHPPTGRGAGGDRGRLSLHQPDAYGARQVVIVDVELPPIERSGDYLLVFDLVAEDVALFADVDSPTAALRLVVSAESDAS